MPRVMHFEIPAINGAKAAEFYQEVFGWDNTKWEGQDYWLVNTGDDREPGINGAITKPDAMHQGIVITVGVANIDEAEKTIVQYGGVIVMPKWTIPGVGYALYFRDPFGNIMGVMQPLPNAK